MKNEVEIDLSDSREYIENTLNKKGRIFVEGILEEIESINSLIDCLTITMYKNNKGLKLLRDTLEKDQEIIKNLLKKDLQKLN